MINKMELVFNSVSIHLIIVSFSMLALMPLVHPILKWVFKDKSDDNK